MGRSLLLSVRLACRDWLHEFGLSFCGVLALASMLAPLLVLHGVHMGVVERLRENLLRDPAVLVLVPVGTGGAGFDEAFIEEVSRQPSCRFCIGRTRDVASELQLEGRNGLLLTVTLEATAKGDPLFERHAISEPVSERGNLRMVLSSGAARRLEVGPGDSVMATLARRLATGKFQRTTLSFTIVGVLPAEATGMDTGFMDMATLTAIQDFRDGVTSELLDLEGTLPPAKARHFESFRAYAHSLDDVERLEAWFVTQDVAVRTRSRDIANIRNIDATLASVIMLIGVASCVGFLAFMASTSQAAVRRKWKQMGMMSLIGLSRPALLVFPVTQALLTGALGSLLAFCLYGMVAHGIDTLFADRTGGEAICTIAPSFFCLSFLGIQFLSFLASLRAAFSASLVEPSAVIRQS